MICNFFFLFTKLGIMNRKTIPISIPFYSDSSSDDFMCDYHNIDRTIADYAGKLILLIHVCSSCCLLTSCHGWVIFLKSIELPPSGPGPYFRQCTCVIPDNLLKTAENRNHDSLGIGVGTALVGLSSVLLSSSGKKNKFGHLLLYS